MNKKFNLLALAAAASACGALVLTSCGGSGKTHIVLFRTDGLRDTSSDKLTPVSFKAQTVKDGKKMKLPIDIKAAKAKDYARCTWRMKDDELNHIEYPLLGWSESTEDESEGEIADREFDYATPITYDTVLYPLYSKKKVHCLTLNLRLDDKNKGTWNDAVCVANHVWDENWFEDGTSLAEFKDKTFNCVNPLPNGYVVTKWAVWDSNDQEYKDFNWSQAITEDITLVAVYGNKN